MSEDNAQYPALPGKEIRKIVRGLSLVVLTFMSFAFVDFVYEFSSSSKSWQYSLFGWLRLGLVAAGFFLICHGMFGVLRPRTSRGKAAALSMLATAGFFPIALFVVFRIYDLLALIGLDMAYWHWR